MAAVLQLRVDQAKPILRGQNYCWQVIRDLTASDRGRLFTVADVHDQTSATSVGVVRKFLRTAAKAGYLEQLAPKGIGQPTRWRVLKRVTRLPHLTNDGQIVQAGQDAMWNAMRALGTFSAAELAISASTEECPIGIETAKAYIKALNRAGYFRVERGTTRGRPATYRLKPSMNTGPLAPKVLRAEMVYDQNKNAIVGEVEAEEVRA